MKKLILKLGLIALAMFVAGWGFYGLKTGVLLLSVYIVAICLFYVIAWYTFARVNKREETLKQKFMERLVKEGKVGDNMGYFQLVPEEFLSQVDGTIAYHTGGSGFYFKDVNEIFSIPDWREELKRLMREKK